MSDASAPPKPGAPGAAHFARGDYAAASDECTAALLGDPRSADAHCTRARARRLLGDINGAIADAKAAIRLNPEHAWAYRTLADAYLVRGNIKAAIAACDEATRLDPTLAEAYSTRAGAQLRRNAFADALIDCDRAIQLAPQLWGAYITRGNARYHLRDPRDDEDYAESFRLNPEGFVRSVVQILLDQIQRQPKYLFDNCAEYLRDNPRDVTSYARRGVGLLLLGRDDEARADLDLAIEFLPATRDRITALIAEAERLRGGAGHRPRG